MHIGGILMMTQTTTRESRERLILELLESHRPKSQSELAELLLARGVEANQGTLSRDLRRLGLHKGAAGYELPSGPTDPTARVLMTWLLDVRPAQQLLVLTTPPGGAQPLAVALDAGKFEELIGTIAGDDTVLAICPDPEAADRLAQRLRDLSPR